MVDIEVSKEGISEILDFQVFETNELQVGMHPSGESSPETKD